MTYAGVEAVDGDGTNTVVLDDLGRSMRFSSALGLSMPNQ